MVTFLRRKALHILLATSVFAALAATTATTYAAPFNSVVTITGG